jgi:hypothetical protein
MDFALGGAAPCTLRGCASVVTAMPPRIAAMAPSMCAEMVSPKNNHPNDTAVHGTR